MQWRRGVRLTHLTYVHPPCTLPSPHLQLLDGFLRRRFPHLAQLGQLGVASCGYGKGQDNREVGRTTGREWAQKLGCRTASTSVQLSARPAAATNSCQQRGQCRCP